MKNIDWKDVLVRSAKTFIETAVACLLTAFTEINLFETDAGVWLAIGISAASAGCSAVWNGIIQPIVKGFLPSKT